MEQVEAYRTTDGSLFASEAEAREHEGYLQQKKQRDAVEALLREYCILAFLSRRFSSAEMREGAKNAIADLAARVDEWLPELVKLVEGKK